MPLIFNFVLTFAIMTFTGAFLLRTDIGNGMVSSFTRFIGMDSVEKNVSDQREKSDITRQRLDELSLTKQEADGSFRNGDALKSSEASSVLAADAAARASALQERTREKLAGSTSPVNGSIDLSEKMNRVNEKMAAAESQADAARERMLSQQSRNAENMARYRDKMR